MFGQLKPGTDLCCSVVVLSSFSAALGGCGVVGLRAFSRRVVVGFAPARNRISNRCHFFCDLMGCCVALVGLLKRLRVYPRTHGETNVVRRIDGAGEGLSPYTRGNPRVDMANLTPTRSIPVHTGKPCLNGYCRCKEKVYPRTHGETTPLSLHTGKKWGLSPYTRGNLRIFNGEL